MAKKTLSENPVVVTLAGLLLALQAGALELHVSKGDEKMGPIPFISMPAGEDPIVRSDGVVLRDFGGSCQNCCSGCKGDCYAYGIEIYRDLARVAYAENYVLAKYAPDLFREKAVDWFNKSNIRCFRWHESGEFFSWEYFVLVCEICAMFPRIQFYTYSRRYAWIRRGQDLGIIPPNFKINVSARPENSLALKKYLPEFTQFIWDCSNIIGNDSAPVDCEHCKAVQFNGRKTGVTCIQCERCIWGNEDTAVYDHSTKQKHKKTQ